MRVLFVYSLRTVINRRRPVSSLQDMHIGLSYIAGFLRSRGHALRLAVLGSDYEQEGFDLLGALVAEWNPEVVAFTCVSTQYGFIGRAAGHIKQRWPAKYLVLGGAHASLNPEQIASGPFDAWCIGEGEYPMLELVSQLEAGGSPHGIPNLWIRQANGTVEKNRPRAFLQDLDSLPFPDRQMWLPWIVQQDRQVSQVVLPSRGCPYNCPYCCNHAFRTMAPGRYVRVRSPENVLREIQHLKQEFPATNDIGLQSETITIDARWMNDLCDRLCRFNATLEEKISYVINFRIASRFLQEEIFQQFQKANVRLIEIGLESGSEQLRREVLKRPYSNEDFLKAVALAHRFGMRVHTYNMIGIPGETKAMHLETVELNRRAQVDGHATGIFFPYPGTRLHQWCSEHSLLSGRETEEASERAIATLDLPGFSKREIQRALERFEFRISKNRKPLHVRLRKLVRGKISSNPWLDRIFFRVLPLWHLFHKRNG